MPQVISDNKPASIQISKKSIRRLYRNIYSLSGRNNFAAMSKSCARIASTGSVKASYSSPKDFYKALKQIVKPNKFHHLISQDNSDAANHIYIAIRVPKKYIRRSVDRNLIKRRILHALRTCYVESYGEINTANIQQNGCKTYDHIPSQITPNLIMLPGYYIFFAGHLAPYADILTGVRECISNVYKNYCTQNKVDLQ